MIINTSAALFSGIKVRYLVDLTARSDFTCKFLPRILTKSTLTLFKGKVTTSKPGQGLRRSL